MKEQKLLEVIRSAQKALNGGQEQVCHNHLAEAISLLTPRVLHQYTLDGELVATHKNCADASRAIDSRATRQDISLAARGKAHAAGGYRWQW